MPTIPVVVGTPISTAEVPKRPPMPPLERRSTRTNTLLGRGWPPGLTAAMADSMEQFPVRFVVVDNSGSMQSCDGQRLVPTPNGTLKSISASRWQELGDVVNEMAEVARALDAPTHFHFLNPCAHGQYFEIATEEAEQCVTGMGGPNDLKTLKSAMSTSPSGTTPLTESVQTLIRLIAPSAPKLQARGQKAVVVLATDGLPNDATSFVRTLKELERLPVWLVVRLCTNEDDVVDYWSELDAQLETPLETLDDVAGEATEVAAKNPWLTYAPSLHLARTMGLQDKLFDLLDETPLMPSQTKQLIEKILGCAELPEPEVDLGAFKDALLKVLGTRELPAVYNPLTKRMAPWVDVQAVSRHIKTRGQNGGGGGCAIS